MIEEQHDELDFLTSFRDTARQQNKVKSDFNAFMEAPLITMKGLANVLVNENPQTLVVGEMKKIDLKTANNLQFARIQFLINELTEERVVEYRVFLKANHSVEDVNTEIEKLTDQAKEIRKDNKNAQLPKELIDEYNSLKEYSGRIEAMFETVDAVIIDGLTGDLSLDDTNMAGVFFKFKNLNEENVPLFIKEVRRIRSDSTKAIKKVTTSTGVDNNNNELTTVLFFFDTEEEAMTFYAAKAMLEAVYDKYLRVSEGAKATGQFDLISHKYAEYINANLPADNPLSGRYVDPNAPIPVSPPSNSHEEEDEVDFYEKYEEEGAFDNYKGSDFVFISEYIGDGENNAFYITPKEYWRVNQCIFDGHIDIDHILPNGFDQVQESCFVYDGNFDDAKELLIGLGMKEVSENQEEGDDITVYPEDVLFGVVANGDTLSFRFVSRERYVNQMDVHEGELFFESVDDSDEWSIVDDNQWEYKDGSPAYLNEAVEYLLAIGMTHEQELDITKVAPEVATKIESIVNEKVAVANQIEKDLISFVTTQYNKVVSWNRNPSDFSVYWNGSEWKLIMTSEVENEPVRGVLSELKNNLSE